MKAAMKLDRRIMMALLPLACACAVGCGSRAPAAPASPPLVISPVGTTTLEAAEIGAPEDAPHVGKSQRSLPDDELAPKGEGEPRRTDRRPGGGFSGYK
jgi:hypothetical protein